MTFNVTDQIKYIGVVYIKINLLILLKSRQKH